MVDRFLAINLFNSYYYESCEYFSIDKKRLEILLKNSMWVEWNIIAIKLVMESVNGEVF